MGKHRIRRVQEALLGEIDLKIDIKPYLLYPMIPPGGVDKSLFAKKTKPGMGSALKAAAKEESIRINYRNIERIPASLEAHRLSWLIVDLDQRMAFGERLMHDYFEDGQNIEDQAYLKEVALETGVSSEITDVFMNTMEGRDDVAAWIQHMKVQGVALVPTAIFAPGIHLPSLQPFDIWINYCRRAARMQS